MATGKMAGKLCVMVLSGGTSRAALDGLRDSQRGTSQGKVGYRWSVRESGAGHGRGAAGFAAGG